MDLRQAMKKWAKSWHTPLRFLWKSARGVETVVAVGSNRKSDCSRAMRSDRASKIGRDRVNDSSA